MKEYLNPRDQEVEKNYRSRNINRINGIFNSIDKAFPQQIRDLYYEAEAVDDDIRSELEVLAKLKDCGLESHYLHKLRFCFHETRMSVLKEIFSANLGTKAIIVDFSEPYKSDILASFLRGDLNYDNKKTEQANNNDASAEPEG